MSVSGAWCSFWCPSRSPQKCWCYSCQSHTAHTSWIARHEQWHGWNGGYCWLFPRLRSIHSRQCKLHLYTWQALMYWLDLLFADETPSSWDVPGPDCLLRHATIRQRMSFSPFFWSGLEFLCLYSRSQGFHWPQNMRCHSIWQLDRWRYLFVWAGTCDRSQSWWHTDLQVLWHYALQLTFWGAERINCSSLW